MELYIDREELTRALGRVQGIVERRSTNIALSHVLLSATGTDRVRLTATDTMLALVGEYGARVEKAGELSVDAQSFFQIARSLPEPTVHLKVAAGNRLEIKSGRSTFHVVGIGPEDFPPLAARDDKATLKVSSTDLARVIEETHFSVCSDDNRYGLNGAHLEEAEEGGVRRVRIVTTDGNRLSWSEAAYEGTFGKGRRMLLPRKALGEIRKLVTASEGSWEIGFGDRSAVFATEGLTLMVRLVDGEFPNYRAVLPSGAKRSVQVPRDRFADALKRVSIVASDRNHSVRFSFEADHMVLAASNPDLGDAREEIPAELQGSTMSTGFNVRYFQDILAATTGERIQLDLGDALDACLVRFPDRDDCRFVVMPMRLD